MEDISPTGKNLSIIISCDYLPAHDWMTLASWYSVNKNLPDAKVVIACPRREYERMWGLFQWVYRVRVPMMYYTETAGITREADIVIPFTAMAVRTYDKEHIGPVSVKSGEFATFVDYQEGCGKFIPSEWLDKVRAPFRKAVKTFGTDIMTVNELKVLKLWEKLYTLYTAV